MKLDSHRYLSIAGACAGLLIGTPALSATICVPTSFDASCNSSESTIADAIAAAASSDTILVDAGTWSDNLVLNKQLTIRGHQAGVNACGRDGSSESVIDAAGRQLELRTGSAGSVIDGFTFSGGSRAIESTSGPIGDLSIRNNRFVAFTGSAIFLNDSGTDVTIEQNLIDGSSMGGGGALHLDSDAFDGMWILGNCIRNGTTGLFSDGNRNVGLSQRAPRLEDNLFESNETGANLGRKSFEDCSIAGNTFAGNGFDGLQGGPDGCDVHHNLFEGNGRSGLALTGFGGAGDATRGAQDNHIHDNCFQDNLVEGLFLTASQFPGTISTNLIHDNNIRGNAVGLTHSGTELIDAEDNWWGSPSGPTHASNPGGTGDAVAGTTVDFDPWLVAPAAGQPCLPLLVAIDIKPGSDENPINHKSKGKIPVAILSSPGFDAPSDVERTSLTFGVTGDEDSLSYQAGHPQCAAEDVAPQDGLDDLVCHFLTQETGFSCGDTVGILRGQLTDSTPFEGSDSVIVVPCH